MTVQISELRKYRLSRVAGQYAVCRLVVGSPVPAWAAGDGFWSVTKTDEELSVVCLAERVPAEVQAARDWACFWLQGPFDFAETGVLAGLIAPLSAKGVSIFAISTYDTDYILVKQADAARAENIWRKLGHELGPSHEHISP